MTFLVVVPGIVGAIFCALDKNFSANCIWSVSNIILICYNWQNHDIYQTSLFLVYEVIAVFGVLKHLWGHPKRKSLVG